jgi:hypothetical protein
VATLLLALACSLLPLAGAQMETPLKGQGSPGNGTTAVYLSVYLDRLLAGGQRQAAASRRCAATRPGALFQYPPARLPQQLAPALSAAHCTAAVDDQNYRH